MSVNFGLGYYYPSNVSVQTNSATYISNFQATLNGSLSNVNSAVANYVYFQWGTTTNYGSQSPQQAIGYARFFMQSIADLNSGTTYHFRAVAQGPYGIVYGQDMSFTTSGPSSGSSGNTSLSVTKKVINLSAGNLSWSNSVNASPSDVLEFAVTLQAGSQDVHNVIVRDVLPASLVYKGSLTLNNSNSSGDVTTGVNVGTVSANQSIVVTYQAQVASGGNFSFGTTTINNSLTVTSTEAGSQTGSATVVVNKSLVYGASAVSTGLTNYFLTDSFLLPLLIIIAGLWFWCSGRAEMLADKIKVRIHPVK